MVPRWPLLLAAALAAALADIDIGCQIFDGTMVCDSEKAQLDHAEIRTCSG